MTRAAQLALRGTSTFLDRPLPPVQRPLAELSVLDVSEFFGDTSGGVKTYLQEKARYVRERPWLRSTLVVPDAQDGLADQDGVRWYRLRGPVIPWQRPYRALLSARALSRIAAHERPDVIELGSPLLAPWLLRGPARALGRPLVYFHHSHVPRLLEPHAGKIAVGRRAAAALAWRYLRQVNRLAARTFAASAFVVRDLERAGFHNVEHVPLGVDLDLFHPRRRAWRDRTRAAFGLPGGPLALYVGRLSHEKELGVLLAAWPEVERRTGAHLCLVGDGPSRAHFQATCRAHQVHWVQYQSDRQVVADLLAAADLYVSPCSFETFGLAALEAQASGTPVLTPDRGGVAEQILASAAGGLFAAGDAWSLASVAQALLGRDLEALGASGRAFAERHHSWATVFDRLFALYRQAASPQC